MTQNPFEEMERAFERMGRKLEQAGQDPAAGTILVDIEDRGDEYVVRADLPGFDREDLDVRFADSSLELTASHEEESETEHETGQYLRKERRRSSMYRSVHLPDPVDPDGTHASYDNGVLTVTLPKSEPPETGTDIPVN